MQLDLICTFTDHTTNILLQNSVASLANYLPEIHGHGILTGKDRFCLCFEYKIKTAWSRQNAARTLKSQHLFHTQIPQEVYPARGVMLSQREGLKIFLTLPPRIDVTKSVLHFYNEVNMRKSPSFFDTHYKE